MVKCDDCGSKLDGRSGELVCMKCGLNHGSVMVTAREYYTPQVMESYAPLTPSSRGVIRQSFRSKTPESAERVRRLRQADMRSYPSRARHVYRVLQRAKSYCRALALPNHIVKTVENKYAEAVEKGLTKRYREDVAIASIICMVCNHYKVQRMISEICQTVAGDGREDVRTKRSMPLAVRRMVNDISEELGLQYLVESPVVYTWKIASDTGIPAAVVNDANRFLDRHWPKNEALTGRMPSAVAAAVLAAYVKKRNLLITLQAITKSAGTTEVTVRKISKKIEHLVK